VYKVVEPDGWGDGKLLVLALAVVFQMYVAQTSCCDRCRGLSDVTHMQIHLGTPLSWRLEAKIRMRILILLSQHKNCTDPAKLGFPPKKSVQLLVARRVGGFV